MNLLDEMIRLHREGLLGHAYLCVGDPLSEGKYFVEEMSARLLSEGRKPEEEKNTRHRVQARLHPDVHWVEPRGKLRQIKVDDLKQSLKKIHEKSFEGGWKIVVFLAAERLNPSSGNQLLKTLEEPPARTLLLLVSDSPEQILDTLRSRCQTLHLPRGLSGDPFWRSDLVELLRMGPPRNLRARLERAARFRDFFDAASEQQLAIEDADSGHGDVDADEEVEKARMSDARRKLQRAVLSAVEDWYRDVLAVGQLEQTGFLHYAEEVAVLRQQAESLPPSAIRKLLENIRRASGRFEGNLPVQVVLEQYVF